MFGLLEKMITESIDYQREMRCFIPRIAHLDPPEGVHNLCGKSIKVQILERTRGGPPVSIGDYSAGRRWVHQ